MANNVIQMLKRRFRKSAEVMKKDGPTEKQNAELDVKEIVAAMNISVEDIEDSFSGSYSNEWHGHFKNSDALTASVKTVNYEYVN